MTICETQTLPDHWIKSFTYEDLEPGDGWNLMMCCFNSKITSNCWPTVPYPSHPLPPPLRGSASFSYLVPYHRPVCHLAPGHTGVFHKNFLWYKLLALICIITLSFVFPLGMTFRTFTQHFFAEKCTLPLPDSSFWEILFPLFCYCIYPLISLCQLLFRRNKTALSSFWDIAPDFYEGKGDVRMITNNGLQLSLPDQSNSTFKICIC